MVLKSPYSDAKLSSMQLVQSYLIGSNGTNRIFQSLVYSYVHCARLSQGLAKLNR